MSYAFEVPEPPNEDREALAEKLGASLRGYLFLRKETLEGDQPPEMREVFPLLEVPAGLTIEEELTLESFDRWFAQVFHRDEPRFYARCSWQAEEDPWDVDWIGEAWLAKAVEKGRQQLLKLQESLDENVTVWLVSSRRFRFTAFVLVERDQFLIVSRKNQDIPLFEPLSREDLRRHLLDSEGPGGWRSRRWRDRRDPLEDPIQGADESR